MYNMSHSQSVVPLVVGGVIVQLVVETLRLCPFPSQTHVQISKVHIQ